MSKPNALSFEGNIAGNWTTFKKEFQFYMTVTELNNKPEDVKTSGLLTCVGEKARHVYYTFTFEAEDDATKLQHVIDKLDEYLNPRKNITFLRFKFFSYNQGESQLIDDYVTELKARSQHCEFEALRESLIRDKIVLGVQDKKIQERLLRKTDLSLDKARNIFPAAEEVKVQTKEMQNNKTNMTSNVGLVKHKSKKRLKPADRKPAEMIKNCKYCGGSHLQAKCLAYGKKCNICFKNNHFAKVSKQRKTVKAVNISKSRSTSDSNSENEWFVGSIEIK